MLTRRETGVNILLIDDIHRLHMIAIYSLLDYGKYLMFVNTSLIIQRYGMVFNVIFNNIAVISWLLLCMIV